jgi:hypothetical protein
MEMSGQRDALAALTLGRNSGSHAIGALYVGLTEINRLENVGIHENIVLKCTLKKEIAWDSSDWDSRWYRARDGFLLTW